MPESINESNYHIAGGVFEGKYLYMYVVLIA